MTEKDINLNHAQALRQADELRIRADELRDILSECNDALQGLESAWTGPSSQEFLTAVQEKTRNLRRVPDRLEVLARSIEKTAALYRQAELKKLRAKRSIR